MKWGIATIMYESAKPWYCKSLVETFRSPKMIDVDYIQVDHLYPANARELAAKTALSLSLDGVLWIDSDMEWSISDIYRMLKEIRDNPGAVIAFPYPARKLNQWIGTPGRIGFGFTWTPIECFQRPEPWFNESFKKGIGFTGEDVWFTKHLPKNIPVVVCSDYAIGHAYEPGPRRSVYDAR